MGWRVGIDIGGTFTDLVLVDEHGQIHQAKTPSSRISPSECIRPGVEQLAKELGLSVRDFLGRCELIIHGTTVGLNTLIQHKGARVGLMCTEGFRDSLEIRLAYKEERYDHAYQPPPLLVPRYLRLPVEERIDKHGNVRIPLKEDNVRQNIQVLQQHGVEAVAVCFLWSFLNPSHERRVGEIIKEEFPDVYLSLSTDVFPQLREYNRTSTTVVNAYLGPVLKRYLEDIEKLLRSVGYMGEIRYMQSNAGIASGDIVKERSVLVLNSGPAAGPTAGLSFSRMFNEENIITIDMGGTSFDACLVRRGLPDIVSGIDVHRYRVGVPMININTIGAGGGSIARVDVGMLRVGPTSAEAEPGPACYGRGGLEPTVTDANMVLGYFPPGGLLGGDFRLDSRAAQIAIEEKVAKPLGIGVGQAALAVFNLVNRNMADAINEVSLERGHDPRDYTLVVAGGCGPAHAGKLAKELGITSVLIPKMASTFCAFGAVAANLRHDYGRSHISRVADLDLDRVNRMLAEVEREGREDLELEGVPESDVTVLRSFEMRYLNQIFECAVPIPLGEITQHCMSDIVNLFHETHEEAYAHSDPGEECELVALGVTVMGRTPKVKLSRQQEVGPDASAAKKGERPVLFEEYDEYVSCPIYDGEKLRAGNVVTGPAVVEEVNTTIVVFPGCSLKLDGCGVYALTFNSTLEPVGVRI